MTRVPRATYRLQLRGGVGFDQATGLVPYLHRLGVSDLYLSPPFMARAGSTHGYDVVDPNRLEPELGGEAGFERLAATLRDHGMGLLIDIVPNHMGVGADNPWWWDVLKHGRASRYAGFFDIDFERDPDGKLVLPVLGSPLAQVLERGELAPAHDPRTGERTLRYFDETFPLAPGSEGETDVARLVDAQAYRPVFWKEGTARRNYRRFFNIDQLAGLKVEDEAVFEASHRLILDLVARDLIQGLRVDHIDGLTEPKLYLERLQRRIAEVRPEAAPFYVVVEKIVIGHEALPEDWPVAGTTGYEFMNEALGLLVAPEGLRRLDALAAEFTGEAKPYPDLLREAKGLVLERLFAGELAALVQRMSRVVKLPEPAAEAALRELLLAFPVYRTYGGTGAWRAADADLLARTFAQARERLGGEALEASIRLESSLRGELDGEARTLLWGLQQLSGPLMAKSAEDTAFYRHARLVALNEVGGEPDAPGLSVAGWHAVAQRRQASWPGMLLATATHDTKRGEDARTRLAVLTELPDAWGDAVRSWRELNAGLRAGTPTIHPADEYLLYQALVGAWPSGQAPDDAGGLARLAERLKGWQQKSLREGKERSDWNEPDQAYEAAAAAFLAGLLEPARSRPFLDAFAGFIARLAPAAAANSLAQLVLKLTAPGVPDIYQGTERWDFSLVDPDNRRPVDFAALGRKVAEPPAAEWGDGSVKQAVLGRVLQVRQRRPELLASGDYLPLAVEGPAADHVVSFARRHGQAAIVTVLARHQALMADDAAPEARWSGTAVMLPDALRGVAFVDILGSGDVSAGDGRLLVGDLLRRLPVAVLLAAPDT